MGKKRGRERRRGRSNTTRQERWKSRKKYCVKVDTKKEHCRGGNIKGREENFV